MTILCCGDRHWNVAGVPLVLLRDLARRHPGLEIVHGDATGADRICGAIARRINLAVHVHPADWSTHGKAAGPIRNQAMLDAHPDIGLVLAFHDNLAGSKGTLDMVTRAIDAGIPVDVICSDGRRARLPPSDADTHSSHG